MTVESMWRHGCERWKKLRTKLLSPQPPEKKVSKYRLYKCTWQVGDVYAYRLESEYSREKKDSMESILFFRK